MEAHSDRDRNLKWRRMVLLLWSVVAAVLAPNIQAADEPLIMGVFPPVLTWAAGVVGVEVPLNLVFFVSVAVLFLVCIQHSAELTVLESEARTLAETAALHELRIRSLEEKLTRASTD